MKGLFVLYEGLPSTIFDSQVLAHVLEMRDQGVEIEILSFNTDKKLWKTSINNLKRINSKYPEIKITLIKSVNIFFPLAFLIHILQFKFFLIKRKYNFIHARADYSQFISLLTVNQKKVNLIWDCRGDSLDEMKLSLEDKNIIIRLYGFLYLLPLQFFIIFWCKWKSNRVIFVSEKLKDLRSSKYLNKFEIIPCTVTPKLFYYDSKLRIATRTELNISENDLVFIYSGGLAKYQSFNLLSELFNRINSKQNIKLLVLTIDIESATKTFSHVDSNKLIIKTSCFDLMNKYYNAADIGILLRDDRILNNVASPTKFGEYSLTGLTILTNKSVHQIIEFGSKIGNIIQNFNDFKKFDFNNRENLSQKSKKFYSRKVYTNRYKNLYF